MKNKKIILHIILIPTIVIIVSLLTVAMTRLFIKADRDTDYQKLGIKIEDYEISYFTVYEDDGIFCKYKVYKLVKNSMDKLKNQLKASELWNREKYYEYIMKEFYEKKDGERIYIDREDLYYYHGKGAYAIFDLKNAKLYYFENRINNHHVNESKILEIKIDGYINREIYSVRGGLQFDGEDYYVYNFDEEKGKDIEKDISNNKTWSKEKLDDNILKSFKHNSEVLDIENAYYHYKKICRTSDEYKKEHFTDEEATGYEVGVYDIDNHILYYFWESI